jgi:hypothetical protein
MYLPQDRANEIAGALFLIGLGLLFYFGFWPGIMFVIGTVSIVQALAEGRGWYALQAGAWSFGIGIWALFHFNMAVFFVLLGVSALIGALVRPPFLKPKVDNYLE